MWTTLVTGILLYTTDIKSPTPIVLTQSVLLLSLWAGWAPYPLKPCVDFALEGWADCVPTHP